MDEQERPRSTPDSRPSNESGKDECLTCNRAREVGAKFCPNCGKNLTTSSEPRVEEEKPPPTPEVLPPAPPVMPPPNPDAKPEPVQEGIQCDCGQSLPIDARYCLRCGHQLGQVPDELKLVVIDPERPGKFFAIEEEVMIGKAEECDVVLKDEFTSRRHARVCRDDGLLFLEDLGSSNGTFLRVRRPINLEPDDEILVGRTILRVKRS